MTHEWPQRSLQPVAPASGLTSALQFSGGKDSTTLLHLLRPYWPTTLIVWLNTGAAFPETIKQMEEIKALVPHFHEITTDVHASIADQGYPTDILPIAHASITETAFGREPSPPRLRSWLACCMANIWGPMHHAMLALGITTIYRATRKSEKFANPKLTDGITLQGITLRLPIWEWTDQDVDAFLAQNQIPIPAYYDHVDDSLDCWVCTAFLEDHESTIMWMKRAHPEKYAEVQRRLREIHSAIQSTSFPLNRLTLDERKK